MGYGDTAIIESKESTHIKSKNSTNKLMKLILNYTESTRKEDSLNENSKSKLRYAPQFRMKNIKNEININDISSSDLLKKNKKSVLTIVEEYYKSHGIEIDTMIQLKAKKKSDYMRKLRDRKSLIN